MKAVIQRCTNAEVKVDGITTGKILRGFMVLIGIGQDDTDWDIQYLARKIAGLRIFEDENEKLYNSDDPFIRKDPNDYSNEDDSNN